MIYRFLILSDEEADFKREIQINAESTFFDLHQVLLMATGYSSDEIYSFFICDDDWRRRVEVALYEIDASYEEEVYLMMETPLEELLEDEEQRLIYRFDATNDRVLYMELSEIILRQNLSEPSCTYSQGRPPEQKPAPPVIDVKTTTPDVEEVFYGDSEFDHEELPNEEVEEEAPDDPLNHPLDEPF